jgi:hypothetical protein
LKYAAVGVTAAEPERSETNGLSPGFLDNLDQYFMDDDLFVEYE